MKIVIEVELGNDEMRTMHNVRAAVDEYLIGEQGMYSALRRGESGRIGDLNGNTVGRWFVMAGEVVPASQS